mgnify:FL=1
MYRTLQWMYRMRTILFVAAHYNTDSTYVLHSMSLLPTPLLSLYCHYCHYCPPLSLPTPSLHALSLALSEQPVGGCWSSGDGWRWLVLLYYPTKLLPSSIFPSTPVQSPSHHTPTQDKAPPSRTRKRQTNKTRPAAAP